MPTLSAPDLRRQIKARLLTLPPRAFELFAGDLLEFMGLRNVSVTRYSGDGGIDAIGSLETSAALISIPTGVQVKRYRANVQCADIDTLHRRVERPVPAGHFHNDSGLHAAGRPEGGRRGPARRHGGRPPGCCADAAASLGRRGASRAGEQA